MPGQALGLLGKNLENYISTTPSVVLDNARFLMLVMVVTSNMITPELPGFLEFLSLMNPFQTRTLAFISGFVNQPVEESRMSLQDVCMKSRNTLTQILLCCLLLEPICYPYMANQWQSVTLQGYFSEIFKMLIFPGANLQWYLYGLLWWRFLTWLLGNLEWRLRMLMALMLSAAAKTIPASSCLSISESFACLPLFVAGDVCRHKWQWIEEKMREELEEATPLNHLIENRIFQVIWGFTIFLYLHLARCVLGGMSTCPRAVQKPWTLPEIYRLDSTSALSGQVLAQLNGFAGDLLILGEVMTFLLLICPRDRGCFKQGRHTLAPYLLHHMLMPSAKSQVHRFHSFGFAREFTWIFVLLFSYTLVWQLSGSHLGKVFDPILQPFPRKTTTL